MAAAMELQYLPPRRGRSRTVPWSTESIGPNLALVQFSQAEVPARSISSSIGSTTVEGNDRRQLEQLDVSRRVRLKQLSDLQLSAPAASRGSSSNRIGSRKQHRRTDHERESHSTGEHHLKYSRIQ